MLSKETIKKLNDNSLFKLFIKWVIEEINKIDSASGLTELSNDRAGEEAKIREKTSSKLRNILAPFLIFKERKEPSAEKIQEAKDKVGL